MTKAIALQLLLLNQINVLIGILMLAVMIYSLIPKSEKSDSPHYRKKKIKCFFNKLLKLLRIR